MTVKVHFDGRIFGMQSHGGITRVFLNLFHEYSLMENLELHLHLEPDVTADGVPESINIHRYTKVAALRPDRLFRGINKYLEYLHDKRHFLKFGNGIFHSTYYSTFPTPKLSQVFTLHDMIYEDYPEYFTSEIKRSHHIEEKKRCISAADVIVCDSEATRERLIHHYTDLAEKKHIKVIHLGFDLPVSEPGLVSEEIKYFHAHAPYLLHVGRRHAHKNFKRLLEAMSRKELVGIKLISIGGGDWTSEEYQLIKKLGIEEQMLNIPQASDEQLVAAYKSSKAVVIPSITEGFGLPLLEALGHGCLVASSTGGSLPEVGGDTPFYFDPFNIDQMVDAIVQALAIRNTEEVSNDAMLWARRFSWENCAHKYVELYTKLNSR